MSQKISLYSQSDLKSSTDDAIPGLILSLLPGIIKQQHYLANVRLGLGYSALAIAGVLFYVDWKLGGWQVTKPYTLPACVAYFVLNAALTYWITVVDRGTVFSGVVAVGGDGQERGELTLRSSVKKHDPTYRLQVIYTSSSSSPSSGKTAARVLQDTNTTIEGRFSQWFNMHGYLDKPALKSWLVANIDVLRQAQGQAGSSGSKKEAVSTVAATVDNTTTDDAAAAAAVAGGSTGTTSTTGADVPKKSGKSRKKKT